jgi:hypothetical protein
MVRGWFVWHGCPADRSLLANQRECGYIALCGCVCECTQADVSEEMRRTDKRFRFKAGGYYNMWEHWGPSLKYGQRAAEGATGQGSVSSQPKL